MFPVCSNACTKPWTNQRKSAENSNEWKDINFCSHAKDWKKFETHNKSIAFNILFIPHKKKEIRQAYISKLSSERPNQVILSIITSDKEWRYFAVKSLSRLLRVNTLNHDGDYYCINYLYSFRTESKLNSHENVCKDQAYCHMIMPEEGKNNLNYNQAK